MTLMALTGLVEPAFAAALTIGIVGVEDDARYQTRLVERNYPAHAAGRPLDAVRLALAESESELRNAGHEVQIKMSLAKTAEQLPQAFAALKSAKVQYLILDLPDELLRNGLEQAQATGAGLLFNIGSGNDDLRGAHCMAQLLHTYPSESMRSDALVQLLVSRSWTQALVLQGPEPMDQLQREALERSAKRFGLKISKVLPFKLSSNPRERDLANVRLLTADKGYDLVWVLDSRGEFARTLPYNTQWPRIVAGSSGLVPLAWHPQWEQSGGPQLTRRFMRLAQRPMDGQDWAAWVAVKSIVAVLTQEPKATLTEQLQLLRGGKIYIDGFKGPRLSYRPWDGQLRQPVFLGHPDAVAAVAPVEGVMHPTEVLDTLGFDEKENLCRKRPS